MSIVVDLIEKKANFHFSDKTGGKENISQRDHEYYWSLGWLEAFFLSLTRRDHHWDGEEDFKWKELNAPETPWLLICDVFKGQWTEAVKSVVKKSNGKIVPVPNNWTNYFQPLQPLDLPSTRAAKISYGTRLETGTHRRSWSRCKKENFPTNQTNQPNQPTNQTN